MNVYGSVCIVTGVSVENGCSYTFRIYDGLLQKFPGKEIIIGETGWPTEGNQIGRAIPSNENQAKYFKEFTCIASSNKVSYYYFEAFDESWKENHEGKVGAHWGIWDSSGMPKVGIKELITTNGPLSILRHGYQAPPKLNCLDSGLPF